MAKTSNSEEEKEPDWYSVEFKGIYSFSTIKNLLKILEKRIVENTSNENTKEIIKIS